MSLAGLDTPAIDEALKTVLQERAGWFILKYETRDTVELLAQGVKGSQEMRDAAITYYSNESDVKPLFGLAQFRRRKVLVKLVPDDTSRLFKARVQVHLFALTTRFPAFDITYEITSPQELDDHQLGQHFDLHSSRTSPGSSKKTTLGGIDEAAEEGSNTIASDKKVSVPSSPVLPTVPRKTEDTNALIERSRNLAAVINEANNESQEASIAPITAPEESQPENQQTPRPKAYPASVQHYRLDEDNSSLYDTQPRLSSQTARPDTSQSNHDPYAHLFQPKVKLGPRPSMDKRPVTASSEKRSVAALPASIRSKRLSISSQRPTSRDTQQTTYTSQPIAPSTLAPTSSVRMGRRPGSSGASIRSLPATLPKSTIMTPEKARLLKFRDLYRQRELAKSGPAVAVPPVPPLPELQALTQPAADSEARDFEIDTVAAVSETSDDARADSGAGMEEDDVGKQEDEVKETNLLEKLQESLTPVVETEQVSESEVSPESDEAEMEPRDDMSLEEVPSILTMSSPDSIRDSDVQVSTRASSISVDDLPSSNESSAATATPKQEMRSMDVHQLDDKSDQKSAVIRPITPTAISANDVEKDVRPTRVASITGLGLIMPQSEQPTVSLDLDNDSEEEQWANKIEKRHALFNPISGDSPPLVPRDLNSCANSSIMTDDDYDDDLMDELDSAVVEEATTINMPPKSPITPLFSRSSTGPMPGVYSQQSARRSVASLVNVNTNTRSVSPTPPMPSPTMLESRKQTPDFSKSITSERISALPTPPRVATPVQDENLVVPKKGRLGTGIAARLANLQKNMGQGSQPTSSPSPNTKNYDGVRKTSLVTQRANAIADSSTPTSMTASWTSRMQRDRSNGSLASALERTPTPDGQRSYSAALDARINMYEGVQNEKSLKPETITVTATIVRTDRNSPSLARKESSATLHESPLAVSHAFKDPYATIRPATTASSRPSLAMMPSNGTDRSNPAGQSEVSATNPLGIETYQPLSPPTVISASPRRSMDSTHSGWRSFARRLSKSDAKGQFSPPLLSGPMSRPPSASPSMNAGQSYPSPALTRRSSIASLSTLGSVNESSPNLSNGGTGHERKKGSSRAGRMMRRMSNGVTSLAGKARKGQSSASASTNNLNRDLISTVHEDEPYTDIASPVLQPASHRPRPLFMDLGDLNVQFPDNLLWKRRWVCIDGAGFLVLKPVGEGSVSKKTSRPATTSGNHTSGINVKKFHLSEFWQPFAPDLERRELSNSIVLDMRDGRCLQCACEGAGGQAAVLQMLLDAWRGWQD